MEHLEIGIVVLNAGVGHMGPFKDLLDIEVEQTVNLSVLQVAYMIRYMIKYFHKSRPNIPKLRHGIVVVSSIAAEAPVTGFAIYSAAKRFSSQLTQAISYELKDTNIDMITFNPAGVSTKLAKKDPDPSFISPDRASRVCLRDLGYESHTIGSARHEFFNNMIKYTPTCILNRITYYLYIMINK